MSRKTYRVLCVKSDRGLHSVAAPRVGICGLTFPHRQRDEVPHSLFEDHVRLCTGQCRWRASRRANCHIQPGRNVSNPHRRHSKLHLATVGRGFLPGCLSDASPHRPRLA